MLTVTSRRLGTPDERAFEVVERKGIGHPDTIADLLADQFSFLYSRFCITTFGEILNHAVDKVTLVGASTTIYLGGFEVVAPAKLILIGNITVGVGTMRVPIYELLRQAAADVFDASLPDGRAILENIEFSIQNTFSSAADRPRNFYQPASPGEAQRLARSERGSNDTVFCTAFAGPSRLERMTLELEIAVTSRARRQEWPGIGTDVKVMATRHFNDVDITMCVPVDPRRVANRSAYQELLMMVNEQVTSWLHSSDFPEASLHLNTKDAIGGMYLAPFGTSLGKSDCGAVGRGNRQCGYIAAFRPANIEAPAGKNPLHHAGRLYMVAAQRIADGIHLQFRANSEVTIVARNGDHLATPAVVNVDFDGIHPNINAVRGIAVEVVENILDISHELVTKDPVVVRQRELDQIAGAVQTRGKGPGNGSIRSAPRVTGSE